jgi:uncharacterized protein (TIGR03083 family)
MALDFLTSAEDSVRRAVTALDAAPGARIPWSEDWTVADCAHHVAGFLAWLGAIVAGRPDAGFEARAGIDVPAAGSPELGPWLQATGDATIGALRALEPSEPCWSWWPDDQTIGFWQRRAAHELGVHRWDLEQGAGTAGDPMPPPLAADGVDELLDVFVGISRLVHQAPGDGETFHVHCTDTDGEWLIRFTGGGGRELTREHAKGDVALRGPAEALLLHLWGRGSAGELGVEVLGDPGTAARWKDLVPPM